MEACRLRKRSLPQEALAEGPHPPAQLRRTIMMLAWPVMIEQILASATQIIDMIMIGRLGPAAVTGVGLSFQPFFFVFAVFMGLSVGTTAVVARHIGAGEPREAGQTAAQSVLLAAALGVVIAIPGYLWADKVITLMGAEPEVVELGTSYIRTLVWGAVFMLLAMLLSGALRGAGDTRTPMKVALVVNVVNVVGNYVLIFGHLGFPAMGVRGAALATSLARAGGGIALIYLAMSGRAGLRFGWSDLLRVDRALIRRIMAVGVPAGSERMIMGLAQVLYARTVASLGTVAYAAHAIALNAESVAYMPAMGFATAASTTVGQALGAKRPDLARRYGWECGRMAMIMMGVVGVLLFVFPQYLMRLYTDEVDVVRLGVMCLRLMAPAQIFQAAGFVFAGALRGAGDTRRVMFITVIGIWAMRLGLTTLLILAVGVGLAGAWIAMGLDWVVRATLLMLRFRGGAWEKIKV